jgi:hypothetical protein
MNMLRQLTTAAIIMIAISTAALAQEPSAAENVPSAADPMAAVDAEGFRAVDGYGDADTIPGGRLMLAAYLAFFGLLAGYTVQLARKHRAVQAELGALRRAVEDLDDRLDEATASRKA